MRKIMLALFVWCFQITMAQAGVNDLPEQSGWMEGRQPYHRGYVPYHRHLTPQGNYASQRQPRRPAAEAKHYPTNDQPAAQSDMAWVGPPAPGVREISVSAEREMIAPPGNCAIATAQGGPCGCVVANMLGLPRDYKGLNLWLADDWQQAGPRTAPHVGAVAIWPRRHVELVSAVDADGSISTRGSVGFSHINPTHLVFIELHGRYPTADGIAWQLSSFGYRIASGARYVAARRTARIAYTGRYRISRKMVRTFGSTDGADEPLSGK
jgi:hypothetical protein